MNSSKALTANVNMDRKNFASPNNRDNYDRAKVFNILIIDSRKPT